MNLTRPLTPAQARLIRIHVMLIPVYGWLLLVWTAYAIDISPAGRLDRSGHIKGHDFAHFYVLGEIANDHAADDLYSFTRQAERMDRLVATYENRFLPIHAPQVAVFFGPFARLRYENALAVWLILSAGIYAVCCWTIWTTLPILRKHVWVVALLAAAFPAFYSVIAFGQTSAFALLWLTLGFVALKKRQPWLAGLSLGCLAYKPTLLLVLPLAFIYGRQFTVLIAGAAAVTIQFVAAWFFLGMASIIGYVHNFRVAAELGSLLEAQPLLMHSLRSFFSILLPDPSSAIAAYLLTALVVMAAAIGHWKSSAPLEQRYAVLLLATILVDPHVYTYELVALVPALMAIASWLLEQPSPKVGVWIMLALSYALPGFPGLTAVTRVQWSVLAFATLMAMVMAATRSRERGPGTLGEQV
jgi:hypothetical protein